MALRARIQSGGGSPLRVLLTGANPNNPNIEQVVFDANHSSLRVLQVGRLWTPPAGAATAYYMANGTYTPLVRTFGGRIPIVYGLGYETNHIYGHDSFQYKLAMFNPPPNGVAPGAWCLPFVHTPTDGGRANPYVYRGMGVATTPTHVWTLNWARDASRWVAFMVLCNTAS